MKSFNQKTKVDLPNLRKRQTYKNTENEADCFNLLFDDSSDVDLPFSRDVNQKGGVFKGYHFYIAIVFILFIAACFFVVQMVINSPEIEKYKTVAKNIEYESDEPVVLSEDKSPENNVPDVKFADSSVSNPVISNKVQISKTPQIKTVVKPHHVIAHKWQNISIPKKTSVVKVVSKPVNLKNPESRIEQAVDEIMLRPLAVSSESGLRELHRDN